MESIWEKRTKLPSFPPLEGDLETDVLIVGGGLTGLLCAHRIGQAGVRYALIEGNRICSGVTARTTAKITSQHGLVYGKLLKTFGRENAKLYWQANEDALDDFCTLAERIDCGFQKQDHWVYAVKKREALEEEILALDTLGIPYDSREELPLPFPSLGAVGFRDQAQFDPLKFACELSRGLHLYEHTPVREFQGNTVITDRGRIRASKVIMATHYPILNKHGGYFLRMYQQRSYVVAVERAMHVDGMYLAAEEDGFSFRNQDALLLIGQGGHRTGKKSPGWEPLKAFCGQQFPQGTITAQWANQDCMTLDGMPYIGRYSRATPNLFVAAGFNKWGMTQSMAAARILTELVQDREYPYGGIFSPQRSSLHRQLLCNGVEATVNLLTPTRPRCPHLGCALKWNPQERSWDCPCHGSRFSEKGTLLNEPATGNLPDEG